jgi:predicted nucleic acid-binding protein
MVIVDTSVLIDYFGNQPTWQTSWLDTEIGSQRIGITSLILAEVLQGIRSDKVFETVLDELSEFFLFESADSDLAIASARNYRLLRKRGISIRSLVDTVTATFCIEGGHELLHNDRDFEHFRVHLGLKVVSQPADASKNPRGPHC